MASPVRRDARRFRRRILTIGVVAFGVLFVVGAPIYLDRVEADLERRVPTELAAAGHAGVTAVFDGQDGTLTCDAPLTDPEDARQAAYDVWGVRAIDLDRSCRVKASDDVPAGSNDDEAPPASSVPPTDDSAPSAATAPDATDDTATETTQTTPSTTEPLDFETLATAVSGSPQLSLLTVLLQEADMTASLSDAAGEPVTLFAPTDEAFESLSADVLAAMRSDPEQLSRVLRHHLVDGAVSSADLVDGPVEALEGGPLDVAVTGDDITVDGAPISVPDLMTANGIVHIVDAVLVPEGLTVVQPQPAASVNASLDGNVIALSGVVASEAARAVLTAAAGSAATDSLTVDPDTGLDVATAEALATVIAAMPDNLVNGDAGFDGDGLYLTGTYRTEAGRDAATAAAEGVGATVRLEAPVEATAEDAVDLEAELNEFVDDNPILFESGSATLSEASLPIVDQLAALAQQFEGVALVVEGHTDSDGDPEQNLQLSRMRAFAVQQALVERGLSADAVTFEGFGSQEPVLVDGVEDKDASRRVEFRVETT